MRLRAALFISLIATAANADITLRFDEGAPKDRFTLTNTSACALPPAKISIDLGPAPAGLIFDVTRDGAGVEVFQPFEMVTGAEFLRKEPQVLDGDSAIALEVSGLEAGRSIAFTIDVDDTNGRNHQWTTGWRWPPGFQRLTCGRSITGLCTHQCERRGARLPCIPQRRE